MFEVADDLVWEQVLAEPIVAQPLQLKFDERGRLWIVQYRQYPYPEGLKVLSRDKYWRVQYDKVPPAPPNHDRGRDKITIHEDTDGDGQYDKHKTFVDGLNLATAVELGRGGVWVLNPPYLLFYPDADRDDVPDGDPEVHLSGFGLSDSHSVVNSLTWGPDGWLYAAQGSTVHGQVKRPGSDEEPVHSMGQLVWRYRPDDRRYEIFAEGGGNAFGVEIDSAGRIFSGHNGGNTRGFHYVQGGYYRKGFSKHGPLSNPYAFGYFEAMQHHDVPRFTHTFVIYEGGALPKHYQGKLLGVEPLQSQIVLSDVMPRGSSFKTEDITRPVKSQDQWFRPVDIKVGPDGAVYVADFFERWPSHREHYDGKVYSDNGRVYRLRAKGRPLQKPLDLSAMQNDELIELLEHENKWVRRTALRLLGDRQPGGLVPVLQQKLASEKGAAALEYLWALNLVAGRLSPDILISHLDHDHPQVRLWTARLLCDEKHVSEDVAAKLAEMAAGDGDVEVRTQLACSARRLPAEDGLAIVRNLLKRDEDVDDVYQALLLWWAIESNCADNRDAVLQLFASSELWDEPLVEKHITHRLMRRFAAAGTRKDLLTCARLFEMAPQDEQRRRLLTGFEEAYEGRSLANLPEVLVRQINELGGGSLALRVRGGDKKALAEALKTISDEKADRKLRLELIEVFGEVQHDEAVQPLLEVVAGSAHAELRRAALTSLQTYNRPEVGKRILQLQLDGLPPDVAEVALAALASRPAWSRQLLRAVDEQKLKPQAVGEPTLRKILLHDDETNRRLVKKHFGEISGATTSEMRMQVERLADIVRDGSGDPYDGKKHYANSCGKCHRLFEEGADIGPNLTSYQRDNLEAMLLNIVNPSAEIREGFETHVVYTVDGRVLSGFLADQDKQIVVLRTSDGQRHSLQRNSIEEMRPSPRSIMPEKLLDPLEAQQVRDLFAYLRSRQPLND